MEVNEHKTLGIKLLATVDIAPILKRLPDLDWDTEEDFDANYNKNDKGALKQTQHAILRFADKRSDEIRYLHTSRWELWKETLLPIMEQITQPLGYKRGFYPKIMFAKLPAGQFILPHVDGTAKGYVPHKIHLPVTTNTKAYFFLDKERHHFETGKAYEVNNGMRHSVVNGGSTDRVHLIFEYLNADIQPKYIQKQIENNEELTH